MPFQLTERDLAVLSSLLKHRYLSVSQIQRLHFPSQQVTYRRLRALGQEGLVRRFGVANIPEGIFHLKPKGIKIAAAGGRDGFPPIEVKPKDHYFMRHFLQVTDVWIQFEALEGPVRLVGFIPEFVSRPGGKGVPCKYIRDRTAEAPTEESVAHIPDAVFCLEREGKRALFFLEVDRGTEELSNPERGFLKSARFYLLYLLSGRYRRYRNDFQARFEVFRTLYVTDSESKYPPAKPGALML